MVYRHIYWGLLSIGPNENNLLTEAVKTKYYLVKIVTPFVYATKEEAQQDPMEYEFVTVDEGSRIVGLPGELWEAFEEGGISEDCPMIDIFGQRDWPRYRLLRLMTDPGKSEDWLSEILDERVKPFGKNWNKLAPAMGRYPIDKVASSIIAIPDVSMKELKEIKEEKKDAGHGE